MANEFDQNDPNRYRPENLKSWMTESQYAQYLRLNNEFISAYGSNFGDFNYYDYLTDPEIARNTDYFARTLGGTDPQSVSNLSRRSQALQNMKDFFQGIVEAPQKIDASPYFDAASSEIGGLYEQQRRQVSGDVNRAFAGAENRVAESLAGTGLGRSGAAVSEFSQLETQRAMAETSGLESVETARLATEQRLAFDKLNFDLNQELLDQGWDRTMIQDALNFQRQMQLANFQAALEYEPSSWLETLGQGISISAKVAGIGMSFGWWGVAAAATDEVI